MLGTAWNNDQVTPPPPTCDDRPSLLVRVHCPGASKRIPDIQQVLQPQLVPMLRSRAAASRGCTSVRSRSCFTVRSLECLPGGIPFVSLRDLASPEQYLVAPSFRQLSCPWVHREADAIVICQCPHTPCPEDRRQDRKLSGGIRQRPGDSPPRLALPRWSPDLGHQAAAGNGQAPSGGGDDAERG